MPFSSSNTTDKIAAAGLQELICPYFESGTESRCLASNRHVTVSIRQIAAYCSSDDHDRCPLFLAKALLALRL
ncbi:MAG: hypothetical protein HGA26_09930 [Chlorobiaceae bacterium]|nr:hypothetical protein [Chlorobiaceae bacterium]